MKEILFLIFGLVWSFNDAVSMDQVNYSKCFERNRTSFFCPDSQLHEFPENITKSIQYLDLTGNYLKIIPSDIGRFVELKYLNLGRNLLTGLPDNFKELCKLERLDLSNNDIHDITAGIGVITKLPNLRILNIKGNSITSLENLASEVVRAVDASHCSITNMTNTSLLGLPDLRSLTLAGNPLKTLQDIQSEKLKWLDLSTCRLNYLVADTFKKLPALEYLKLSHNPKLVYSTRKETLKHSSLKKLDASGCNLDRPGIHGLPSLTHVTLSHNMIHFLPDYIFVKNGALIHLNLSFNGLLRINACSLIGMPKLAHLDLSGNHLENISASAFRDNIELKSLNISHNGMRNFPRLVASVVNLDLSTNLIEYIPRDSLRNMWRIDSLILSGNRLERFETGMASRTLKTLILKENGILRLSTGSLENLPMLRNIDLSGNRLTEGFQSEVFSRNPELNSIELHNNPWHCDCNQLLPIYLYLTQSPMKRTLRTLMCHSPNDKSGYLWTTACNQYWTQSPGKRFESNRSFVIVVLGVFLAFLVFASTISIGHTVKTRRRQAELRVREAERAEARERLLLHRRSREMQSASDRSEQQLSTINPAELLGPPTYEEALEMTRIGRSLDTLNYVSSGSLGHSHSFSSQNVWERKKRMQRKGSPKRARSENDLLSRRDARPRKTNRIIRRSHLKSPPKQSNAKSSITQTIMIKNETLREQRQIDDPTSETNEITTKTGARSSMNRKKRHHLMQNDGNSSDDEDSDNISLTNGIRIEKSQSNVPVIELLREPRGGTHKRLTRQSVRPLSEASNSAQIMSTSQII